MDDQEYHLLPGTVPASSPQPPRWAEPGKRGPGGHRHRPLAVEINEKSPLLALAAVGELFAYWGRGFPRGFRSWTALVLLRNYPAP